MLRPRFLDLIPGMHLVEESACRQASTFPIPPKALPVSKTSQHHVVNVGPVTSDDARVPVAAGPPTAMTSAIAHSTTWATCIAAGPWTFLSPTPSTGAIPATADSPRICPIWHLPAVTTPTGSSPSPSAWLSRTACLTDWPLGISGVTTGFSSPSPPFRTGSKRRGEKAEQHGETEHLDWALADFSGYLAADELYDGPFCVLSAVDSPNHRRLLFEVLDHTPDHSDIRRFLARLKVAITARGVEVRGVTTDGSPLYPQPLAEVFPNVPHQVCVFHVLKELTKAVLRALAGIRKRLSAQAPAVPRGRPKKNPEARRLLRQAQRIEERVGELFEHRHLFVRHHLTATQRAQLSELMRGERVLRALRAIMDEVYRLFDRRCRSETALAKLAKLRVRVGRYRSLGRSLDKLKSPTLEKALEFLDDKLMPATSNAVERGNRRHRKMQKSVYQVRTKANLEGRMALDLQRERQATGRESANVCLHRYRKGGR